MSTPIRCTYYASDSASNFSDYIIGTIRIARNSFKNLTATMVFHPPLISQENSKCSIPLALSLH